MSNKLKIIFLIIFIALFGGLSWYFFSGVSSDEDGKHFIKLDESTPYVLTGESEVDFSIWSPEFPSSKKQEVYSGGFDGLLTLVSNNSKVVVHVDDSPHEPSIPQLSGMINALVEGVDEGEFHYLKSVMLSGVNIQGTGFENAQAYLFVDKDSFKDGHYDIYLVSEDREFSKLKILKDVLPFEMLELYIG